MARNTRAAHPRAIPRRVLRAIERVRGTGLTDMYDRETVMMLAAVFGFEAEAEWLLEHRHLYDMALEEAGARAWRQGRRGVSPPRHALSRGRVSSP